MTGAEVAATVRDARAIARQNKLEMVVDDLQKAIRNRRPFIDKSLHWQIAVHECGHAIAGYITGRAIPHLLTIHGTGGAAAMSRVPSASRRADYEKDLVCLLETGVLTGEVLQSYLDRLAVTPPAPDPDAKAEDARDQGRMVADQEKLEPS
ncbi:MAG: hypothetical protein JJU08_03105 [Rhodobacteraceae bacterium]|nr:hypothetical protein [Paracoccaceae bacterium]